jgi:hypothetical protein
VLYSFFNLGARWGWVVNATPQPLYPWLKPGTHFNGGGWVPWGVPAVGGKCGTPPPPPPGGRGFDPRIVQPAASRYTDCACGKVVTHRVKLDIEVCKFIRLPTVLCYHMR